MWTIPASSGWRITVIKLSYLLQGDERGADPAECGPPLYHPAGGCHRHPGQPLHRSASHVLLDMMLQAGLWIRMHMDPHSECESGSIREK